MFIIPNNKSDTFTFLGKCKHKNVYCHDRHVLIENGTYEHD